MFSILLLWPMISIWPITPYKFWEVLPLEYTLLLCPVINRWEMVFPAPISILQLWPRSTKLSVGSMIVMLTEWLEISIELSVCCCSLAVWWPWGIRLEPPVWPDEPINYYAFIFGLPWGIWPKTLLKLFWKSSTVNKRISKWVQHFKASI